MTDQEFTRYFAAHEYELRVKARRYSAIVPEEDLLQDALLKAWRFRHQYQPGTKWVAWMNTIIRTCALTARERQTRNPQTVFIEEIAAAPPYHSMRDEGFSDAVHAALESLPEEQRAVVLAIDVRHTPHAEVAEELGINIRTVGSRLIRGRNKLARSLSEYGGLHGFKLKGKRPHIQHR